MNQLINDKHLTDLMDKIIFHLLTRVRNRGVRVGENLLISFSLFHSEWAGEGERKNNSKFTDPNPPISDSASNPAGVRVDLVVALLQERQQRRDALPYNLHRRRRVLVPVKEEKCCNRIQNITFNMY